MFDVIVVVCFLFVYFRCVGGIFWVRRIFGIGNEVR